MTHSVVNSTSAVSAKLSLPLIVIPPSAGGLTSRITSLPLAISTLSPAAGTMLSGHVAGSDQSVSWATAQVETQSRKLSCRALVSKGARVVIFMIPPRVVEHVRIKQLFNGRAYAILCMNFVETKWKQE